ncbi:hypothetical protein T09_4937 [Trichinella sp. T9]|nr:hypothetical protein T09_4937 [Trichinella sp. T9]
MNINRLECTKERGREWKEGTYLNTPFCGTFVTTSRQIGTARSMMCSGSQNHSDEFNSILIKDGVLEIFTSNCLSPRVNLRYKCYEIK